MKRSLIFVCFAIALLYVVRSIEYAGIKKNKQGEFAKLRLAFEDKNNFDLVVIGSSRAECAFYTPMIDSSTGLTSFNLGMTGATMPFIRSTLEAYLENSTSPKYVILNLDLHSFADNPDTIYSFPRYFAFLNNEKLFQGLKARDHRFTYFKYLPFYSMPFYSARYFSSSIRGWIGKVGKYDPDYVQGFAPYVKNNKMGDLDTLSIPIFNTPAPKYEWDEIAKIDSICKKNNSKLIFVLAPIFHRWEVNVVNYGQLKQQFHSYADLNAIPFIDLSEDSIRFNKELYSDGPHLDKAGAMLFTSHFIQDFRQYIRP